MQPPRDLAVAIGSDLPFQLHVASDPAAVHPEVRFDVGSARQPYATGSVPLTGRIATQLTQACI